MGQDDTAADVATKFARIIDGTAWDGNRLAITSTAVMKKLDRPYLSVSAASSLRGCGAAFVGEKAGPRDYDVFGPAELGTDAHSVIEGLYNLPADQRTKEVVEDLLDLVGAEKIAKYPAIFSAEETMTTWRAEVKQRAIGIFKLEVPSDVIITANEMKIEGIEVAGVPFLGYLDRVSQVKKGAKTGESVSDYKAGKVKLPDRYGDDHGDQLRTYAEARRVMTGTLPLEAHVLYISHGVDTKVPLTEVKMKASLNRFSASWDTLQRQVEADAFDTKAGPLCGWCPLVNACPSAKAEGFIDRKGGAPLAVDLAIPTLRAGARNALAVPVTRKKPVAKPEPAPVAPADPVTVAVAPPELEFGDDFEGGAAGDLWSEPAGEFEAGPTTNVSDGQDVPPAAAEGATDMTANRRKEAQPWIDDIEGQLNLASWAATATGWTTDLAVALLTQSGLVITRSSVSGLTSLLAEVIIGAERAVSGHHDWASGANKQARFALRTVLAGMPIPFGDLDALQAWKTGATRRCTSIVTAQIALYEFGPVAGAAELVAQAALPVAEAAPKRRAIVQPADRDSEEAFAS